MGLTFPILALLLAAPTLATSKEPDCLEPAREVFRQNPARLACDISDISKRILAGQSGQVPKKIYHFGKKEYLLENARNGTIPEKVWREVIMGSSAERRYELGDLRKGLYGTDFIDTNFFYQGRSYGWINEIEIADECRAPAKVLSFLTMADDARFHQWVATQKAPDFSVDSFRVKCPPSRSNYGYVFVEHSSYWNDIQRRDCEKFASQFIQEAGIKVLQDQIIPKSFYLRDRTCIKSIRGKPLDVLEIFAENPALWIDDCTLPKGSTAAVNYGIIGLLLDSAFELRSSGETHLISDETLKDLERNASLLSAGNFQRPMLFRLVARMRELRGSGELDSWLKNLELTYRKILKRDGFLEEKAVAELLQAMN